MRIDRLLVTCEHGGNDIPDRYRRLFAGASRRLGGHEGWDPGALVLARELSRRYAAPLVASTTSRLLVDLNRSPHARTRFSPFTRDLPAADRERIARRYYLPYRARVEELLERWGRAGHRTLHVSVHSFTPVRAGVVRSADVGLLYDPARDAEVRIVQRWRDALLASCPTLRVRRNYPYRGVADGLTSALRRRYPDGAYAGVELEVSQAWVGKGPAPWQRLRGVLIESLAGIVPSRAR